MRRKVEQMPHLTRTETKILEILLAAGVREMYGLEIVKGSGGVITRGSVYVLLSRMVEKGLVESRPEPAPEHAGGPPRVLYKASGLGVRAHRAVEAAQRVWGLGVLEGAG